MATNITSISGVISVSMDGGIARSYFGEKGKYTFMANQTTLQVYIGGDSYNIELSDLQVNGQAPASLAEALVLLNAVFLNTNSSSGGSGTSYLVYTAFVDQDGTNAPVLTVLEDTLAFTITPAYYNVGLFDLNFSINQEVGKIVPYIQNNSGGDYYFSAALLYAMAGTVIIGVQITSSYFDAGAIINANGLMTTVPIEIRVYP